MDEGYDYWEWQGNDDPGQDAQSWRDEDYGDPIEDAINLDTEAAARNPETGFWLLEWLDMLFG